VGESITFVGLDVHKATIAVCVAEAGRDGEVRFVGEIPHEPQPWTSWRPGLAGEAGRCASPTRPVRVVMGSTGTCAIVATTAWWSRRA
jgi:hypothetical protein